MNAKLVKIILFFCLLLIADAVRAQEDISLTVNGVSFTMKYVEGDRFVMGAQREGHHWANFDSEAEGMRLLRILLQ